MEIVAKMITLERFAYTPMGTFGRLLFDEFECYTVERPWLNNKPRESCIPEGTYPLKLGVYNRGGYPAYEVLNVPNRSLIKIHVGNTIDDVIGCIAPGKDLSFLDGKWGVTGSRKAYNELMSSLNGITEAKLKITHYKPQVDLCGLLYFLEYSGQSKYVEGKDKIRQAKIAAEIAKWTAKAQAYENDAQRTHSWEVEALKQSQYSWKDEFWTVILGILLIGPMALAIVSVMTGDIIYTEATKAMWQAYKDMPYVIQGLYPAVILASMGMRYKGKRDAAESIKQVVDKG